MAAGPARWTNLRARPVAATGAAASTLGVRSWSRKSPPRRAPCHRVRPLLPGAAAGADPQVGIERAFRQLVVLAVDPGRDCLTQPVALHVV
jgi:hypothetical protein